MLTSCGVFGILGMILAVGAVCALGVLAFSLWIMMIIDCCGRKFDKGIERIVWLLVLLLSHIVGSLIYYVLIKKYHPTGLLDKEGQLR